MGAHPLQTSASGRAPSIYNEDLGKSRQTLNHSAVTGGKGLQTIISSHAQASSSSPLLMRNQGSEKLGILSSKRLGQPDPELKL